MNRFSPRQIKALKKQAKRLKKDLGYSQSAALDTIAKQYGYRNWSLLQKNSTSKDSPNDPALIFDVDKGPYNKRILKVATIRYASDSYENPDSPGQLIFRCPECKEVHYHGAVDWHLGAGDGHRTPHCVNENVDYSFDLVEVLDPAFAGYLPSEILEYCTPPTSKSHIKNWFISNHTPAVDIAPWDGKEGGYQYPTYDGSYDIHDLLCRTFPSINEDTLFEIAEEVSDEDGPWVTYEFLRALEIDSMLER